MPQGAADRGALARMLVNLFEHWQLSSEEQLEMLGLASANRAALARYRKGEPIAPSRDMLERAGHLFGIHKSLRLLFPRDRNLAYAWMRSPNRAFGGLRPADVVREHGFAGLLMLRAYLDRARGR